MADSPRLLVSVRHAAEARIAIAGGVDLLDLKEPSRGALGRVDARVLEEVTDLVGELAPALPLSLALGEVTDPLPSTGLRLPDRVRYFKLGLAGLRDHSSWVTRWLEVRREWEGGRQPLPMTAGSRIRNWIAVAYADDVLAKSPPVQDVVAAAIKTGCCGVLFDTFTKAHGTLLDWLPQPRLACLVEQIQAAGLLCAAAGRVSPVDIPILADLQVDIIAVRSAATANGNREQVIDAGAIARLQAALQGVSGGPPPTQKTPSAAQSLH